MSAACVHCTCVCVHVHVSSVCACACEWCVCVCLSEACVRVRGTRLVLEVEDCESPCEVFLSEGQ